MQEEIKRQFLETLESGRTYKFSEWSNEGTIIPQICAGVYTIWQEDQLIYVGMAGRSLNAEKIQEHRNGNSKAKGLSTRLRKHASGSRSGDQFCVYVGDRLILPTLTTEQIKKIATRQLSFDSLIRDHIRKFFTYRFVETEDDKQAFQLEIAIKKGILKAGKPLLNPAN